jgi:hypothetical protein
LLIIQSTNLEQLLVCSKLTISRISTLENVVKKLTLTSFQKNLVRFTGSLQEDKDSSMLYFLSIWTRSLHQI